MTDKITTCIERPFIMSVLAAMSHSAHFMIVRLQMSQEIVVLTMAEFSCYLKWRVGNCFKQCKIPVFLVTIVIPQQKTKTEYSNSYWWELCKVYSSERHLRHSTATASPTVSTRYSVPHPTSHRARHLMVHPPLHREGLPGYSWLIQ